LLKFSFSLSTWSCYLLESGRYWFIALILCL